MINATAILIMVRYKVLGLREQGTLMCISVIRETL